MGVEYSLFWSLNPKKMEPFIEAFQQRATMKREQMNFTSWLTGMYVTHAVAACFGKNHQYPREPISLEPQDEQEKSQMDAQRFEAFAISFNQEFRKKSEKKHDS